MSAALHAVERGGSEVPEVTSLAGAVRAWLDLDNAMQNSAILTPERPVSLDGEAVGAFEGQAIRALADQLPSAGDEDR